MKLESNLFWFHCEEIMINNLCVSDASYPSIAEQREHIRAQLYKGDSDGLDVFINGSWMKARNKKHALRLKFNNTKNASDKSKILKELKQLKEE